MKSPRFFARDAGRQPAARRLPALVVYLHPFRIVRGGDREFWRSDIDEVNSRAWNYTRLHEIAGEIDLRPEHPARLLVGIDGALALVPDGGAGDADAAVRVFNGVLAALLLSGIYCEPVTRAHVQEASIFDSRFIRAHGEGRSPVNQFHDLIRLQMAPPALAIHLVEPRTLAFSVILRGADRGREMLAKLPAVSAEVLLRGAQAVAGRDWAAALVWLSVLAEQLTAQLWRTHVLDDAAAAPAGEARRARLGDEGRWTAELKQEILHQRGVIPAATMATLAEGSRARAALAAEGAPAGEGDATPLYRAVLDLLAAALPGGKPALARIALDEPAVSAPFKPLDGIALDSRFRMAFPRLPREDEILEAERRGPALPEERRTG